MQVGAQPSVCQKIGSQHFARRAADGFRIARFVRDYMHPTPHWPTTLFAEFAQSRSSDSALRVYATTRELESTADCRQTHRHRSCCEGRQLEYRFELSPKAWALLQQLDRGLFASAAEWLEFVRTTLTEASSLAILRANRPIRPKPPEIAEEYSRLIDVLDARRGPDKAPGLWRLFIAQWIRLLSRVTSEAKDGEIQAEIQKQRRAVLDKLAEEARAAENSQELSRLLRRGVAGAESWSNVIGANEAAKPRDGKPAGDRTGEGLNRRPCTPPTLPIT